MGKETDMMAKRAEAEMEARIFKKLSAEVERLVDEKTKSRSSHGPSHGPSDRDGLGTDEAGKKGAMNRYGGYIELLAVMAGMMVLLVVVKYFLAFVESLP